MSKIKRKPNVMPRQNIATRQQGGREIKIERTFAAGVSPHFSDALMVQQNYAMFYVTFLQTQHPLVITDEELKAVKGVEQRVVAQIIVTPEQMAQDIKAMLKAYVAFAEVQEPATRDYLRNLLREEGDESGEGGNSDEDNEAK